MLEIVKVKELDNIIRIGESVKEQYSPGEGHGKDYIKNKIKEEHYNIWKRKVTHGFLEKKLMEDTTVDRSATNQWLKSNMSSHVEGYLMAMQEQEINTKDALKRKEKNLEKKRTMNNSCRLCHKNTETLFHITTGCPEVSSSLYLNIRHNAIAKVIFQSIINKNEGTNHRMNKGPEPITHSKDLEIWWDRPITLPRKIPHNRPDIVVWDKVSLTCTIIDISVPLDLNISSKIKDKQNDYMLLMGELQMLYPTFKYKIVPVVIGAFGTVTTQLKQHLQSLGFDALKCEEITRSIQKRALIGSMKICKTILKM